MCFLALFPATPGARLASGCLHGRGRLLRARRQLGTGMSAWLPTLSLHISFLSSQVVGGDARLRLRADQDCLFFRDGEADLHACLIIRGADKMIHVTSSRGEPCFSSPSCCTSGELPGLGACLGRQEGRAEPWGEGDG